MAIVTWNLLLEILTISLTFLVGIITYYKWRFTYWKSRGVETLNPTVPFGDAKDNFLGRLAPGSIYRQFYNEFNQRGVKFGGIYVGPTPHFIPIDRELIKNIMQKDFVHFVNHGVYNNEENDPLRGHLFNLEDEKWRTLRVKLTPTFTSGKMKMMFQTLVNCADGLYDLMAEASKSKASIEIRDIAGRFTTDIIGSTAFGLECNSLKDPDSEFRKYGRKIFQLSPWERIKWILQFVVPHHILNVFHFRLTNPEVEKFFKKVVKDTVDYREKNNIYRKDFMHLLLQLKNRGTVADDGKIKNDNDGKIGDKIINMNELTAQAFVFFLAGFETSSTTMSFAVYELALNQDIQQKLRDEINTTSAKYNEDLTYDAIINEMPYLDQVIDVTLRKYPPVPLLPRKCNKDYKIPETNIIIEKGIAVDISIYGIHHNKEFYPEPEKFDPERFSEENKKTRPAFTWLPFGDGPRVCIGARFGKLQTKVGLITLLKDYKIKLSPRTKVPLSLSTNGLVMSVIGGIWVDVDKIL